MPEPTALSHHDSHRNTGNDARKRHASLARSTFLENDGLRPKRQASITRNAFLSFPISLNEVIRPATHMNQQSVSMERPGRGMQLPLNGNKIDDPVDMRSLNVLTNYASPVAISAATEPSPGKHPISLET
jgi:hypothetical protein